MMLTGNYWRRRAERLEKQIHSGDSVPISRIIRLYKQAFDEIENDIRSVMSARDEVNRREVEELKAEMLRIGATAPDPIRRAQINRAISAYDYRIDRMELLKSRAYAHLMKVAGRAARLALPHLKNAYKAAMYGTVDDIAEGLNIGIDFSLVPKRTLEKVISAPFRGKNYSQRIWDNTAETAGKAQKIITKGLVKGSSYPHMARELAAARNNTYYNAYRLIQTETTHFTERGRFDAYKEIGVEKYTYYATLGAKTCDVCAALDGKTFDISEAVEGKNMPPIHPHCMCYTVIGNVNLTSRLAKDPETGKNYKVRGDMTYNEWYNGLSQEKKTAIKAYKNRHADSEQYGRYIERLGKENMPKTLDLFQKMKYNDNEKWNDYKYYYRNVDGRPIEYVKIDRELAKLGITNKGKAYPVEQLEVNGWRNHAEKRIVKRGIDKAEALSYKENAIGMMVKYPMPQTQYNYYSYKGVLGVRVEDKSICTAYSDKEFKEETKKILEVMNKWLNL